MTHLGTLIFLGPIVYLFTAGADIFHVGYASVGLLRTFPIAQTPGFMGYLVTNMLMNLQQEWHATQIAWQMVIG